MELNISLLKQSGYRTIHKLQYLTAIHFCFRDQSLFVSVVYVSKQTKHMMHHAILSTPIAILSN
jgi:hypothetical protein